MHDANVHKVVLLLHGILHFVGIRVQCSAMYIMSTALLYLVAVCCSSDRVVCEEIARVL